MSFEKKAVVDFLQYCARFIELSQMWEKDVCLFGAGDCGSGWGYDLVREAGFSISFYIDNFSEDKYCNGLPIYNIDYLKGKEENVLCIVTVMGGPGLSVMQQLKEIGMQNVLWIHEGEDICIELPQYLDERGEQELIDRFPSLMDDVVYLKKRFVQRMGYELNLDCPRTFNEKLQWLKLFDRKPIYTDMVDKAAVKKIVADRIGEQYTIQTLGVYDSFDQIDFSVLPESFVLKCTHDSGSIVICKNIQEFDKKAAENKLEEALKKNYFWPDREWPYKDVPRKIIAESFLESKSDVLEVYKIFNFWGSPELIQVIQDDKTDHETIDYFDVNWSLLNLHQNFPNSENHLSKPKQLEKMLQLARALSKDIPFIRTDFYLANDHIYFSEFTFFTDSGCEAFHPSEWDEKLGELLVLPEKWGISEG